MTIVATPTPTEVPTRPTATVPPIATPVQPAIGTINFTLGATDDLQPIDAAQSFKPGITQIHALFDYQNFAKDDIWERVWYLVGTEMLRSSEPWTGDSIGTFDYFLETGG